MARRANAKALLRELPTATAEPGFALGALLTSHAESIG